MGMVPVRAQKGKLWSCFVSLGVDPDNHDALALCHHGHPHVLWGKNSQLPLVLRFRIFWYWVRYVWALVFLGDGTGQLFKVKSF